uniref:Ribosomal protein L14 n=1 Tax=Marsupiomonas sp. NIES 1824 TaxID=1562198 RepID=A0A6H0R2X6_9CHLO|nr:ribosomal protein L14 [Marsupiomonas sp. NIES 1824]
MRRWLPAQRTLSVRDNSGAKRRRLLHPRTYQPEMLPTLSRVVSGTTPRSALRKGRERKKVVQVLLLSTRRNQQGANGIVRRNRTTRVVLMKDTSLRGSRILTKLPKQVVGKGRTLRPVTPPGPC